MATTKTAKTVKVLGRITYKAAHLAGYVVYVVLSSNGKDTYRTTLANGKATGCTCPATKPCYHMTQLETYEVAFTAQLAEADARMAAIKTLMVALGKFFVAATYAADKAMLPEAINPNTVATITERMLATTAEQRHNAPLNNHSGFQFMAPEKPTRWPQRQQEVW